MNRVAAKIKSWFLGRPVAETPPATFAKMYGLAAELLERMADGSQSSLRLPSGTVMRKVVVSNTTSPWGYGQDRVQDLGLVYQPDGGFKTLVSEFPLKLHAPCAFIATGNGPEYTTLTGPEILSFPDGRQADAFIGDALAYLGF